MRTIARRMIEKLQRDQLLSYQMSILTRHKKLNNSSHLYLVSIQLQQLRTADILVNERRSITAKLLLLKPLCNLLRGPLQDAIGITWLQVEFEIFLILLKTKGLQSTFASRW